MFNKFAAALVIASAAASRPYGYQSSYGRPSRGYGRPSYGPSRPSYGGYGDYERHTRPTYGGYQRYERPSYSRSFGFGGYDSGSWGSSRYGGYGDDSYYSLHAGRPTAPKPSSNVQGKDRYRSQPDQYGSGYQNGPRYSQDTKYSERADPYEIRGKRSYGYDYGEKDGIGGIGGKKDYGGFSKDRRYDTERTFDKPDKRTYDRDDYGGINKDRSYDNNNKKEFGAIRGIDKDRVYDSDRSGDFGSKHDHASLKNAGFGHHDRHGGSYGRPHKPHNPHRGYGHGYGHAQRHGHATIYNGFGAGELEVETDIETGREQEQELEQENNFELEEGPEVELGQELEGNGDYENKFEAEVGGEIENRNEIEREYEIEHKESIEFGGDDEKRYTAKAEIQDVVHPTYGQRYTDTQSYAGYQAPKQQISYGYQPHYRQW